MATYLKHCKSEFMSKAFKVHDADDWFLVTSENNFANSTINCIELDALRG